MKSLVVVVVIIVVFVAAAAVVVAVAVVVVFAAAAAVIIVVVVMCIQTFNISDLYIQYVFMYSIEQMYCVFWYIQKYCSRQTDRPPTFSIMSVEK